MFDDDQDEDLFNYLEKNRSHIMETNDLYKEGVKSKDI